MSKLFVYGIDQECSNDIIKEIFSKYGDVKDVDNTRKGFAFVTMANQACVDEAIQNLDGTTIENKRIQVRHSRPLSGKSNEYFDSRTGENGPEREQHELNTFCESKKTKLFDRNDYNNSPDQCRIRHDHYSRRDPQYQRDHNFSRRQHDKSKRREQESEMDCHLDERRSSHDKKRDHERKRNTIENETREYHDRKRHKNDDSRRSRNERSHRQYEIYPSETRYSPDQRRHDRHEKRYDQNDRSRDRHERRYHRNESYQDSHGSSFDKHSRHQDFYNGRRDQNKTRDYGYEKQNDNEKRSKHEEYNSVNESKSTKLFVYGIEHDCPSDVIEEKFSKFGKVDNIHNPGKGFAFVTMADKQAACDAIDLLNGSEIKGRKIRIEKSNPRSYRENSASIAERNAKDITNPVGDTDRYVETRKCYLCNQPGHISKNCHNRSHEIRKSITCYNCKEEGHISKDCTYSHDSDILPDESRLKNNDDDENAKEKVIRPNDNNLQNSFSDNSINGENHINNSLNLDKYECFRCGMKGHLGKNCIYQMLDSLKTMIQKQIKVEYSGHEMMDAWKADSFVGNKIVNYDANVENSLEKNIFDSHCHLDRIFLYSFYREALKLPKLEDYKQREEVKSRLPEYLRPLKPLDYLFKCFPNDFGSKFEGCISVCCDPDMWQEDLINWLTQEPNVWLAIGCHPSKAKLFDQNYLMKLKQLLQHNRVVALGEIGLDESCCFKGSSFEKQLIVFEQQLVLAKELGMPICIHLRGPNCVKEAQNVMKKILLPPNTKIHMHCFCYSKEVMYEWMQEWPGMMFGVTPNFFQTHVGLEIPLNRLLLETDSPYFLPKQLTGKEYRSTAESTKEYPLSIPGMVYHTAAQVAALRKMPIDVILASNRLNIEKLYGVTKNMIMIEEMKYYQSNFENRSNMQGRSVKFEYPVFDDHISRRQVVYDESADLMKDKSKISVPSWMKWYGEEMLESDSNYDAIDKVYAEKDSTNDSNIIRKSFSHDQSCVSLINMSSDFTKDNGNISTNKDITNRLEDTKLKKNDSALDLLKINY